MQDDIVTRLRAEKCVVTNGVRRAVPIDPIYLEAADEIERLRAEVDSKDAQAYRHMRRLYDERGDEIARLEAEIRELGSALTSMSKSRDRAIRALTEAVRGE